MEFVATVALRTLLPKLAQLLQDEYKLQKSARKGIEDLCKELEAMDVFLCKVGEVTRDQLDEQHKIWAREVRDLSYDMEDMVDTFMVDIEGPDAPSSKSTFRKFFSKMKEKVNKAMTRREIAKEIMDIKERVIEVADRHKRYNFDANTPHTKKTTVDPRITSLYTDVTELVGIDEAKKEVITRLTEGGVDQQQKNIISIAGFGGLGKTTLARAVRFKDNSIARRLFRCLVILTLINFSRAFFMNFTTEGMGTIFQVQIWMKQHSSSILSVNPSRTRGTLLWLMIYGKLNHGL